MADLLVLPHYVTDKDGRVDIINVSGDGCSQDFPDGTSGS